TDRHVYIVVPIQRERGRVSELNPLHSALAGVTSQKKVAIIRMTARVRVNFSCAEPGCAGRKKSTHHNAAVRANGEVVHVRTIKQASVNVLDKVVPLQISAAGVFADEKPFLIA